MTCSLYLFTIFEGWVFLYRNQHLNNFMFRLIGCIVCRFPLHALHSGETGANVCNERCLIALLSLSWRKKRRFFSLRPSTVLRWNTVYTQGLCRGRADGDALRLD